MDNARVYHYMLEPPDEPGDNWCGFMLSIPGVAVTGATLSECVDNLRIALDMHIRGMEEDGEELPQDERHLVGQLWQET